MKRLVLSVSSLLLVASPWAGAQDVIVSRRVYVASGRSFQQLWVWSPESGAFDQLTRSARDHDNPSCAVDDRAIVFSSGNRRLRFDRRTRVETPVEDALQIRQAAPPADTRFSVRACDEGTASPTHDGGRVACAVRGEEIAVFDVTTGRELERVPFGQRSSGGYAYPEWPLRSTWSPDDARLLVGTYGNGSSSTSAFLDYFVLDLATRHWTRGFSGNGAVWLADGRRIVFTTPRELVTLPGTTRQVWTTQLAAFDLEAGRVTALTSDVTHNVSPTLCPAR